MKQTRWVYLFAALFGLGSVLFPTSAHAIPQFSPGNVNFGSVTVGASSVSVTITITHTANDTMFVDKVVSSLPEFVVTIGKLPITVPPHASTTLQVTFRPNVVASFNGTITVFTSVQGESAQGFSFQVAGKGVAAPATYLLSPSAGTLAFGGVLVGSSASQALSLKNTGTGSVTISQVAVSGADFQVAGFSGGTTLGPGQSLSLTVQCAPAAAGSLTGSISVVSTATNSPSTISLSGAGVQPQLSIVPSSVSFGNVTVGVTNSQTMTIQNPGSANLTVTQATLTGTSYTMSGLTLPLSIAPGGSAAFNVAFDPAAANNYPGSVTLVSNAPTSPSSVALSGTGLAQILKLSASPASLSFGSLTTGTSASQSLTLTNTGNSTVSISQVTASGTGFSASGIAVPLSLAAGQSTSLNVVYAPYSTGSGAGSVTVLSNAANSPLVVPLSGSGSATVSHSVTLAWTPSASSYGGFNVYRSSVSGGPYTKVDSSVIPTPSYIDSTVLAGQTYYYVATELDSSGNESGYSSEVSASIP